MESSELQVDSRRFSSNMTIFVESWWTPDGVHQIHQDYLESTWSMWSKVKYWTLGPVAGYHVSLVVRVLPGLKTRRLV